MCGSAAPASPDHDHAARGAVGAVLQRRLRRAGVILNGLDVTRRERVEVEQWLAVARAVHRNAVDIDLRVTGAPRRSLAHVEVIRITKRSVANRHHSATAYGPCLVVPAANQQEAR